MSDKEAKRHLKRMLKTFTAGSILHLLADLHRSFADEAQRRGDDLAFRQCTMVEHALVVVGMGIDGIRPT